MSEAHGPREEIPLDNPLVRDELARTGEELHRLEVQAYTVIGAIFGFFMGAIFYGGIYPLVAAGFAAIMIIGVWGVKVAAKEAAIRRSRARLLGTPPEPPKAGTPLYKK